MPDLALLANLLQRATKGRAQLVLENDSRTHQALNGNAPTSRTVERVGQIVATPVLGGLHHRYSRAA